MSKYQQPQSLKVQRRELSDALPGYTLRHDPRVHKVQELDVQIERLARELGVKAW